MYPPGDYTRVPKRVPTGTRSDIVKAPAEHRPGPLQAKSGPHRLPVILRVFLQNVSTYSWRIPGMNRGRPIFLTGARATFKLELKVNRGPRGGEKIDGTRSGSLWVPGGGPRVVVSTAAFHARVRGSVPGLGGFKKQKMFLSHPRVKVSIVGSLRDREVACSASDRQGSNFKSCV